MNSTDLLEFIADKDIEAELIVLPEPTPTVEEAARVAGVAVDQICKSILFVLRESNVLVISNGTRRLSWKKVADHLQVSRRKIRLASAAEVADITGFEVGSVPPFGHRNPIRTVIDEGLTLQATVLAGGGEHNALLRISVEHLVEVTKAELVSLCDERPTSD